jgi:hypothetical protein
MTGRSREVAEVLKRRKVDIACVQETKWKGSKAKTIGDGYKMIYHGEDSRRNGVGVILESGMAGNVVDVKRINDRLIGVKLIIEGEVVNILAAYAPQTGCPDVEKDQFWDSLESTVGQVPKEETLIIGGDLNGHVGKSRDGYDRVHGGHGFGCKNEAGETILQTALALDMGICNTYFRKKDEHLITYKSGGARAQIDYILTRRTDIARVKNCKVIPGESATAQHRLTVADMYMKVEVSKRRKVTQPRIKWHKLGVDGNAESFKNIVIEAVTEAHQNGLLIEQQSPDEMWKVFESVMQSAAKEIVGESRGKPFLDKETWWWNGLVQEDLKLKKELFKKAQKTGDPGDKANYLLAKKKAKQAVAKAKHDAYNGLYQRLETKEGEKEIYRLAKRRDRASRDIDIVKCIKNSRSEVLTDDTMIKNRWKSYFEELLNTENPREARNDEPEDNIGLVNAVEVEEVRKSIRAMKNGKAVGPDEIPIEAWKALGDEGIMLLTKLLNTIMIQETMPNSWRNSTLVPIYKNKGDIQECGNYRAIKLLPHTMKLWERVVDKRIRQETDISENQFGFMPGRSTTDAIFALRTLVEKYREWRRDLEMVFIDLEKAYDRVPRDLIWWALRRKQVPVKYIRVVQDMYRECCTRVRTSCGTTDGINVEVGLHQGSVLSPYLFITIMDELTKAIQKEVPWAMVFADDIVLVSESIEDLQLELDAWRKELEANGLKISRTKTERMSYRFSGQPADPQSMLKCGEDEVKRVQKFKYLGSYFHESGEIDVDVEHRVKCGWQKWREATGVICDRRIPHRLKGKFYRTAIRPALTYGAECWAAKRAHEQKLHAAEMRMLRWMSGVTLKDKMRNEHVRGSLRVAPIADKMREARLRWFGHVERRSEGHVIRRIQTMVVEGKRRRGRPAKRWLDAVKVDMEATGVTVNDAADRSRWRLLTRAADPV